MRPGLPLTAMKTITKIKTTTLSLLLLGLAQGAAAQNVLFDDIPIPAAFPQPEGIPVGPLNLAADATVGVMGTNNVYRDASHLSSEAEQLGASTTLSSSGERHQIIGTLEYYSQDFRDDAFQDMDLDATTATVFGRFVTSKWTNVRLLVIDEESILGKEQSDQLNSFNSGLQENKRVEGIFEVNNDRYFSNVMARYDQISSRTFSPTDTGVQADALDRSELDHILLGGRIFSWGRAFVFGGTQAVRYESNSTPSLSERNSDEHRYGVGAEYEVGRFSGDLDVYRFTQRFVADYIPDVENTWVGSGKVNYAASDDLALVLSVVRKFNETNIPNSGGIISDDIFVGAALSLTPRLYWRVGPSYNQADIQNMPVKIKRYGLDSELAWQFSTHFKMMFTANLFTQHAADRALTNFQAQQTSAALSLNYSL
jgi:hypothetical protein